ncbi:unnamed protein product [Sphenostylis stenocarpa]|uniref:Uncharacterized protein n=1 Tax=Sphenostylis stenocarpa TaxID=92480 RepID=A0AA86RXL1_9FABA|nr:unnamed protein product [Sphenostylis stenocarpa]
MEYMMILKAVVNVEYIPAALSRYSTVLSTSTIGCTPKVFEVPRKITALYMAPRISNTSSLHCTKNVWEYLVGKCKSLEPGGGIESSLISS